VKAGLTVHLKLRNGCKKMGSGLNGIVVSSLGEAMTKTKCNYINNLLYLGCVQLEPTMCKVEGERCIKLVKEQERSVKEGPSSRTEVIK